jgi:hypothetical protein
MDIYTNIMQTACTLAGEDVSPGYPHTVTGALDALADVLAGEDVDGGHTIAEAVAAVGENIGGGGGGQATPVWVVYPASFDTPIASAVWRNGTDTGEPEIGEPVDGPDEGYKAIAVTAPAGVVVFLTLTHGLFFSEALYYIGEVDYAFPSVEVGDDSAKHVWYTQPCLVGQPEYSPTIYTSSN